MERDPTSGSHPNSSATDRAYDELKGLILTARLAPGAELHEGTLSDSLGFGRTPIREALKRLTHEGFVEVKPRLGYRVAPMTLSRVRDIFEMRLLLEPMVVDLVVERATDDELADLYSLAHKVYSTDEPESYEEFLIDNRELHVRIAKAGGNAILAQTLRVLLEDVQRLFFVTLDGTHPISEQLHQHHELHDALVERDADLARSIVINQIEASRAMVVDTLLELAGHRGDVTFG